MVILQQVLNFESVSLDYFCSNMVFSPCWASGIILWLSKNIPLYTFRIGVCVYVCGLGFCLSGFVLFFARTQSYQALLCFKG